MPNESDNNAKLKEIKQRQPNEQTKKDNTKRTKQQTAEAKKTQINNNGTERSGELKELALSKTRTSLDDFQKKKKLKMETDASRTQQRCKLTNVKLKEIKKDRLTNKRTPR